MHKKIHATISGAVGRLLEETGANLLHVGNLCDGAIGVHLSLPESKYLLRPVRVALIKAITEVIYHEHGVYADVHIVPRWERG